MSLIISQSMAARIIVKGPVPFTRSTKESSINCGGTVKPWIGCRILVARIPILFEAIFIVIIVVVFLSSSTPYL